MNVKQLSLQMKEKARSLGLCDEWYNAWGDASLQDMLDKLKKGFDFYVLHRTEWFTPDDLNREMGIELLRKNFILANDKFSFLNPRECFLLGKSEATVRCNAMHVCRTWVLGESSVQVSAKGRSHLLIEVYDKGVIRPVAREATARIVVILHSSEASVITDGSADVVVKYAKDFK